MWYAISLGSGLLVGIAFLLWALRERTLRHNAERAADAFEARNTDLEKALKSNVIVVDNLRAELNREHARTLVLRQTLEQAQKRLLECNDPETIKKWLDDELKTQLL